MLKRKGFLIVFEATDSCGKETQAKELYHRLLSEGKEVRMISFPRYDKDSSDLVKMYLKGDFGDRAKDVNPRTASRCYAIDRYESYKEDWEEFYLNGGILIMDRYTQSNMIHQGGTIKDLKERNEFIDWVWNLEYTVYGLPIPDLIFFLDVPTQYSQKLIEYRKNKITNENEKDILEKDINHLQDSYDCASSLAYKYKWIRIKCVNTNQLRSIQDIANEIYFKATFKIDSQNLYIDKINEVLISNNK